MRSTRAFAFFALLLIAVGCAGPAPSVHTEVGEVVCLSAPIENGRAYLAEHREGLASQIVQRGVFVIADSGRDTVRMARVMVSACEPTEERLTPQAYLQTRDQFIDGFSAPNGECTLRAAPTSTETRHLLIEDLLSSGLGGAATTQIDGGYLEITVGTSCDLSEPFIREYLERRGVGGVGSRRG